MMNMLSQYPDPHHIVVTTINDLPNAIMEDILIRLPTKSCFQCSCVSKRWHAFIYSASFAHRFLSYPIHHNRTTEDDLFLIEGHMPLFQLNQASLEDFKALPFSLNFQLHYGKKIKILASCADFLLCTEITEQKQHGTSYYIGNPITRRWVKLPPLPGAWKNHLVGFVFDDKRLAVVHLTVLPPLLEILSSSHSDASSWSSFPISCPPSDLDKKFNGYLLSHNHNFTSLNGRLYLAAEKGVLEYDPVGDSWSFFGYGFKVVSHDDTFVIGSCEGAITLSQLNASLKYSYFRVWELKEHRKKFNNDNSKKKVWYLKQNVKFNRICGSNEECCWRALMNFHMSNGEKVYMKWKSFVALCNLRENTVELIGKNTSNFSIALYSTWAPRARNLVLKNLENSSSHDTFGHEY